MAYIEKEPIIEFITKGLNNPDKTKAYGYDAIEILTEIEYAPTADVVEVVRCEKCKHCAKTKAYWFCTKKQNFIGGKALQVYANYFCSYGERKNM